MTKNINWPKEILHGIHIGEHNFSPENVINEINERFKTGNMNYAVIRPQAGVEPHYFIEWAKYLADKKIYFMFLYSLSLDENKELKSNFTPELVNKIKEIAGEYFLGDVLGEPGSSYTFKSDRYFEAKRHKPKPQQHVGDMLVAKENYINELKKYIDFDLNLGVDVISCVEATIFSHYNVEAGVDIPIMEMMVGCPDIQIAAVRGFAKSHKTPSWGTYVAHEWYGGKHHEDLLKQKRLSHIYPYAYMSGSNIFCLESGDELLESYGTKYDYEHQYCRQYRDELIKFGEILKNDIRPIGGPKIKVAFVYGNLDGWGGLSTGSSIWGQLDEEEWGYSSAEYSWRILDDIAHGVDWHNPDYFGEVDYSSHIPYGMYDIIPATAPIEVMQEYEYIFFVGHNTMTNEIFENLTEYVRSGGKLFMTAAHLNINKCRNANIELVNNGDVSKLFGCKLGSGYTTREGVKFKSHSSILDMPYPGPHDYMKNPVDPFYNSGYAQYCETTLCGGETVAILDNSFSVPDNKKEPSIAVVENSVGNGCAFLLTSLDYPGHGAVYPLYRVMVRNLLNNCHRNSDVRFLGSDKVKFAVYENYKVYMLNTDFDCKACVTIEYKGKREEFLLNPGEFRSIHIDIH